jgi:hypothetical protein
MTDGALTAFANAIDQCDTLFHEPFAHPMQTFANDRNRGPQLEHPADVADALNNDPEGVTLVIPTVGSSYD